jgi:hypothetical protein
MLLAGLYPFEAQASGYELILGSGVFEYRKKRPTFKNPSVRFELSLSVLNSPIAQWIKSSLGRI